MRYIIVGAGAVGGTIGARLFQSGCEVVLVARGAHLDVMRARGLRFLSPDGQVALPVPAIGAPDEIKLRQGDVLVLAVKTQDTEAALADWAWLPVRGGTAAAHSLPVICAQNGISSQALALRRFRHVYGMCVWLPAAYLEPGVVAAQCAPLTGMLHLGRYPSGTDEVLAQISTDLAAGNFLAPVTADVMRWKYGKLVSNLINAVEVLCGAGARYTAAAAELRERVQDEVVAVYAAAGIGYASEAESRDARGSQVQIQTINGWPEYGSSSWQSLVRGAGSIETDFLNGEIVLLGREFGVPTPANEVLQWLANRAAAQRQAPGWISPAEIMALADASFGTSV